MSVRFTQSEPVVAALVAPDNSRAMVGVFVYEVGHSQSHVTFTLTPDQAAKMARELSETVEGLRDPQAANGANL